MFHGATRDIHHQGIIKLMRGMGANNSFPKKDWERKDSYRHYHWESNPHPVLVVSYYRNLLFFHSVNFHVKIFHVKLFSYHLTLTRGHADHANLEGREILLFWVPTEWHLTRSNTGHWTRNSCRQLSLLWKISMPKNFQVINFHTVNV